jgi:hypothetical protein
MLRVALLQLLLKITTSMLILAQTVDFPAQALELYVGEAIG